MLLFSQQPHLIDGGPCHFREIKTRTLHQHLTGLQSRHVQELFHDPGKALRFFERASDGFAQLRCKACRLERVFQLAANNGQRGSDFMGGIG